MDKKNSDPLLPHHGLQGVEVLLKGGTPSVGNFIACMRLAVYKRLGYGDILFFFECFDVRGQVAVGNVELVFQAAEVVKGIGDQHRHDLQPHTVLQYFIQMFERAFHLSYLLYIMPPYTMWSTPKPIVQKIRP